MSDTTQHLQLPKPNPDHVPPVFVAEEFLRLRAAMDLIDQFLFDLSLLVSKKAADDHTHAIAGITGLVEALNEKMPANRQFKLDDLTDVEGAAEAAINYVLVKAASGKFIPSTALAALGVHPHLISEVTGLVAALTERPTRTEVAEGLDELAEQMLAAIQAGGVPIGASIYWNSPTLPSGFMKENGAAISRTAYAELFGKIGTRFGAGDGSTTFNLPDSRAEFIRGLDDGRGVDAGRVLGSAQASQNLAHTHGVSDPSHTHSAGGFNSLATNGAGLSTVHNAVNHNAGAVGGIFAAYTGISIQSHGGTEARPRNVSKLVLIRAF